MAERANHLLRRPSCSPTWPAIVELFHTATGTAYADLVIDGHRETWPIRSTRFRDMVAARYYEATGERPGRGGNQLCAQSDRSARAVRRSRADASTSASPNIRTIFISTSPTSAGAPLKLARTDGGSSAFPPVRFRRTAGMLAASGAGARRIH